jgi:dTDP-4-amino-4,6-dideoxygalactose transaminase
MIYVTRPFLPPKEEYIQFIDGIWKRQWLTNNGPLVNELELKLKEYLDMPHLLFVNNGTMALQIAIKALELKGEIITTPFSYVATTSSIVWENCVPVFVDIDQYSLNIDPHKIEASITDQTSAIIATHVFGNPCDIEKIETIAKKHNLKVIYDAAHCFGTRYKGKPVFAYGDISTTSFHATKLFHTIEGGGVFTNNAQILKKMAFLRNFGHFGPTDFAEVGVNGKNSEFHAAMGLCNLKYVSKILAFRKQQCDRYNYWFKRSKVQAIHINPQGESNSSYYPLIFQSEDILIEVVKQLEGNWISPRRYFFPSLNTTKTYRGPEMPVSEQIAARILCLPLYFDLSLEEIDFIARIVLRVLNNAS